MENTKNETPYETAVGQYDTTKLAAPGVPFNKRTPLTPEQLAKFRPDPKKTELFEIATTDRVVLTVQLTRSGLPREAAGLLAVVITDLHLQVAELEAELEKLESLLGVFKAESGDVTPGKAYVCEEVSEIFKPKKSAK